MAVLEILEVVFIVVTDLIRCEGCIVQAQIVEAARESFPVAGARAGPADLEVPIGCVRNCLGALSGRVDLV